MCNQVNCKPEKNCLNFNLSIEKLKKFNNNLRAGRISVSQVQSKHMLFAPSRVPNSIKPKVVQF